MQMPEMVGKAGNYPTPHVVLRMVDEIKDALIPLKPEEYDILEKSLLKEGCREPLVVWGDIIVDGHHRYEICQKHGIPFKTIQKDFDSLDEAIEWVFENQAGRRNLTPDQLHWVIGKMYNWQKKKVGRPEGSKKRVQNVPLKTYDKLAQKYGVSYQTVKRAAKKVSAIETHAIPEIKDAVKNGKVKLSDAAKVAEKPPEIQKKAYEKVVNGKEKLLRQAASRIEVIERVNSIKSGKVDKVTDKYDVVVIDPPWEMKKIERDVAPDQVEFDYPTMSVEEIANIEIPASDNCHVFLWTTQKYLPVSFKLFEKWGVKYILTFVWKKNGGFQPFNLPQYNCEFVLYGRIGHPQFTNTKAFFTCFEANRTGHSRKPDIFYETICRVTSGKRLDMFNRRKIEGFDGWGLESGN